jgi:outer membrane protein TolC
MLQKKAMVLVIALLWCAGIVFAQENPQPTGVRAITLKEAVDLVLKNNLQLERARISLSTQKRQSAYSWNPFLPSISVSGTMSRKNEFTYNQDYYQNLYGFDEARWLASGSFSVGVNLVIANLENIRALSLEYDAGLTTYEKASAQMEQAVRKYFFDIVLLQKRIALMKDQYAAYQRQTALAETNYRAGRAPETIWLQAQVTEANYKPAIDEAANSLKYATAYFANYVGLPFDTLFQFVTDINEAVFIPLDINELLSRAAVNNYDIRELRQTILAGESRRRALALGAYLPVLSFGWNTSRAFYHLDPRFPIADRDATKYSWWDGDNWLRSGYFTLGLSWQLDSLLPFSAGSQRVDDADDQLESLKLSLDDTQRGTQTEIFNILNSLEKSRVTIEAQKATVGLAERAARLSEDAYRAGQSSRLDLEDTILKLNEARLSVLQQNYEYIKGLIDLEYTLAVPFGTFSKE